MLLSYDFPVPHTRKFLIERERERGRERKSCSFSHHSSAEGLVSLCRRFFNVFATLNSAQKMATVDGLS